MFFVCYSYQWRVAINWHSRLIIKGIINYKSVILPHWITFFFYLHFCPNLVSQSALQYPTVWFSCCCYPLLKLPSRQTLFSPARPATPRCSPHTPGMWEYSPTWRKSYGGLHLISAPINCQIDLNNIGAAPSSLCSIYIEICSKIV